MNVLVELRKRVRAALQQIAPQADHAALIELVTPSQDAKFGDYQANCAMPLGKQLGKAPRDIAAQLAAIVAFEPIFEAPTIAGPGFLNFRLRDDWLAAQMLSAIQDPRLGVEPVATPKTYVIDFSAPNVAKPMHVGHIRSTVIGDALQRTLRFLGHRVITDNHLGDWGTQFGMIIYGYKHFCDRAAYERNAIDELARLYRLVHQLVAYREGLAAIPKLEQAVATAEADVQRREGAAPGGDAAAEKKAAQALKKARSSLDDARRELAAQRDKIAQAESDAKLSPLLKQHTQIDQDVLAETAKLHEGDAENCRLWQEFMPPCLEAINEIYRRVHVTFDETLGESFYHDQLAPVVDDLLGRGLAKESDGALCVFLSDSPAPMIIRKKDGAFLYATTDLATIRYRVERWHPDAILYVVDHRQGLHFQQLFAVARLWGYEHIELQHVSFGTVLGDDGRPFKTRSGDTVGLKGLLDEAVERAATVVRENNPDIAPSTAQHVADAVGIAALKYADLSQNRTSDYTFSYEKMLAMNGNTATYMQYAYARVRSIFRRGEIDIDTLRARGTSLSLAASAERALARQILRFSEALDQTVSDYRPNQLTAYLFELANSYSTFFEQCPVLKAESPELRDSRLLLCDLTARTIRQGLELLGIGVVEQM